MRQEYRESGPGDLRAKSVQRDELRESVQKIRVQQKVRSVAAEAQVDDADLVGGRRLLAGGSHDDLDAADALAIVQPELRLRISRFLQLRPLPGTIRARARSLLRRVGRHPMVVSPATRESHVASRGTGEPRSRAEREQSERPEAGISGSSDDDDDDRRELQLALRAALRLADTEHDSAVRYAITLTEFFRERLLAGLLCVHRNFTIAIAINMIAKR